MKTKSIGIIDSGLGGYTIFNALRQSFPDVSFTFIADQKNTPFGSKSIFELEQIAKALVDELISRGIDQVIVACNTLSATVLDYLKEAYPSVTFHGVIEHTVASLKPKDKTILILATEATIESHAYQEAITRMNPKAWVDEVAAPILVDLIEGLAEDADIDHELEKLLESRNKVDAIVMGCTHFPIISKNIKKMSDAKLVTSIEPMVDRIGELEYLPKGSSWIFTTYDPVRMENQIYQLFQQKVMVDYIELS